MDVSYERFLPVVGHLDRAFHPQRQHAGVNMNRDILPTTESPTYSAQGHAYPARIQPEGGGYLALVVVDPLGRHVEVDTSAAVRHRETGFRTEECRILNSRGVLAFDHYLCLWPGGGNIPEADANMADDVAARVDRIPGTGQRRFRIRQRRLYLVLDADSLDRPAGRLGMVGSHDRHRLSQVPDFVSSQNGLVRHLDAVETVSGYVLGGQHGGNPPDRQSL